MNACPGRAAGRGGRCWNSERAEELETSLLRLERPACEPTPAEKSFGACGVWGPLLSSAEPTLMSHCPHCIVPVRWSCRVSKPPSKVTHLESGELGLEPRQPEPWRFSTVPERTV